MPLRKMQGDIYRIGQWVAVVVSRQVSRLSEEAGRSTSLHLSWMPFFSHSIVSSKSFLG